TNRRSAWKGLPTSLPRSCRGRSTRTRKGQGGGFRRSKHGHRGRQAAASSQAGDGRDQRHPDGRRDAGAAHHFHGLGAVADGRRADRPAADKSEIARQRSGAADDFGEHQGRGLPAELRDQDRGAGRQIAGHHAGARRHRRAHLCAWRQEGGLRYSDARDGAALGGGFSPGRAGDGGRAGLVKTPIRMDWTLSAVGHAGALVLGLVSFSAMPTKATPPESLAADIMSASEFSQLTKGIKTAPKADVPKPLVEKVAEPKPTENPAQKVVDKPEVVAAADEPPKPVEAKPEPKPPLPQARPEPKQREAFARENEPKPDPIAEAIKRDLAKKPEPKQATPTPPKKPEPPKQHPKFDASNIQHRLALLDKRDPQRRAATGDTLSSTPSLGLPTGNAAALSQNEIDALRARLRDCWTVPVGLA